jgi:dihydrofolate reductase
MYAISEAQFCLNHWIEDKWVRISIIAALDRNRVMGNNNALPWHLPADLKHFKALTLHKPVIMGRKTFESIGRPLPQRRNIVISQQRDWHAVGCEVMPSLTTALQLTQDTAEVMIIGGAQIFEQALPLADRLYLTFIDFAFSGNVFFPRWNEAQWRETERITHAAENLHDYSYAFVVLERV